MTPVLIWISQEMLSRSIFALWFDGSDIDMSFVIEASLVSKQVSGTTHKSNVPFR